MPVQVVHLENSRSIRVLLLLEELEIPYELKAFKRDPKTRLGPQKELEQFHPLGKSTVVILEDGTTIAESGAIVEHFLRRPEGAKLQPSEQELDRHASLCVARSDRLTLAACTSRRAR